VRLPGQEYKLAPHVFTECLNEGLKLNLFEAREGLAEQLQNMATTLEVPVLCRRRGESEGE
jgi:hypothetical protein